MDLRIAGFLISCFIFSFKLEREEERPNEKDYFQKKKCFSVSFFSSNSWDFLSV